jgi:hypothetical protein
MMRFIYSGLGAMTAIYVDKLNSGWSCLFPCKNRLDKHTYIYIRFWLLASSLKRKRNTPEMSKYITNLVHRAANSLTEQKQLIFDTIHFKPQFSGLQTVRPIPNFQYHGQTSCAARYILGR